MPGDDSGVWKPLAMSLGSALIGVVVTLVISASAVQALENDLRENEISVAVSAARQDGFEEDVKELKQMLTALGDKIDRYHEER